MEFTLKGGRLKCRCPDGVLESRPRDSQTFGLYRPDMIGWVINKDNVLSISRECGAEGAADSTGAPNHDRIGQDQGPSIRERVSATATSQIACMTSSGF
jgi:hypothetical protein